MIKSCDTLLARPFKIGGSVRLKLCLNVGCLDVMLLAHLPEKIPLSTYHSAQHAAENVISSF